MGREVDGATRTEPRGDAPVAAGRRVPWLPIACLLLAALSLLGPSEPTYDPWSWIVWGRELIEGALDTREGPSWKPLPVLVTAPAALLGDTAAPLIWLVAARAGGLMAIALAFRLASRISGRVAGVIAAVGLTLAEDYIFNFARGNSEGVLVALVLGGIERHLDGHRRQAFLCGFAASLLRPEVWPFVGLYGLWLMWTDRRAISIVVASGIALPLLWLGPEWIGSGNPLRASDRARQPNLDSPAFAPHPWLEILERSASVLIAPLLVLGLVGIIAAAVVFARRRERGLWLAMAFAAISLEATVCAMTEIGYAGNLRYVALPAAVVCVLAGAGATDIVNFAAHRAGRAGAVLAIALLAGGSAWWVARAIGAVGDDMVALQHEADFQPEVADAVEQAGGRDRVLACGDIIVNPFQTPRLAWTMHLPISAVHILPYGRATLLATRDSALSRDPRYRVVSEGRSWIVRQGCGDR